MPKPGDGSLLDAFGFRRTLPRTALVVSVALNLFVLVFLWLSDYLSLTTWSAVCDANLGTAANWLSGLATSSALIFSLLQYRRSQMERSEERTQKSIADQEAQARRVSIWVGGVQPGAKSGTLFVANNSEEPVYACEINYFATGKFERHERTRRLQALPPAASSGNETVQNVLIGKVFSVSFLDSAGRHWRRDHFGELELLDIAEAGLTGAQLVLREKQEQQRKRGRAMVQRVVAAQLKRQQEAEAMAGDEANGATRSSNETPSNEAE